MDHSSHHNHASHSHDIVPNTDPVEHRGMDSDFGTLIDDHGGHGGGSGAGNSPHAMMMAMWFHFGVKETILFEFWKTSEIGTLLGSIAVIFLLSFSYEALKFYREHLYRKSFRTIQYNTVTVPVENGGTVKETQKTVQIGAHSISVDPNFQIPEITPIFISQGATCSCPGPSNAPAECVSKMEISPNEVKMGSKHPSNNNVPAPPEPPVPTPCNMNIRKCSTTISTNVRTAYKVKMVSWMHTWQTFLHMVQVVISYFLMLIFMTYNVWLCLAVVLGAGSGYFFFGWKKSLVVDITEHCH